ncbi:PDZ and LIM domain protein 7 [Apodemus speciosus]|uniref:PDZ and LIM domain protein 7 n=1 Tax=Apodemus speciosus TaxID=105296 RepID=A0ABQ0FG53_APOSI
MDTFKVVLEGPAPWGFRLQGGKDFNVPLSISRWGLPVDQILAAALAGRVAEFRSSTVRYFLSVNGVYPQTPSCKRVGSCGGDPRCSVGEPRRPGGMIATSTGSFLLTPGGKAAQAGVAVGDWVLNIDGENAGGLTHIEAQNKIRACGERLSLGLSRAQPAQSKPQKALTPPADPPRYTFAPSASLNKTARPFGAPPPTDSTLPQNGCRPLTSQQLLRQLVPDASKQRLMENTEDWRPRPGTGQSRSFRILAHLTGTEFMQDPDEEVMKKSREKYVLELQSPRYTRLRDWHHQRSAHVLNVQS